MFIYLKCQGKSHDLYESGNPADTGIANTDEFQAPELCWAWY